jgi:hypothetical protein
MGMQFFTSSSSYCFLEKQLTYELKVTNSLAVYIFICTLALSFIPLISIFTHIPNNYYHIILCFVFIFIKLLKRSVSRELVLISVLLLIASLSFGFYWQEIRLAFFCVYFILALISVSLLSVAEKYLVVKMLSFWAFIILVFSVVGFIYALLGGQPLYTFPNPDGRPSYLFFTTLTNFYRGVIIRPSGIFDEPGTLSFVVCVICYCREILSMDRRFTWLLLLLGSITLSLAHVVFLILFLMFNNCKVSVKVKTLFLVSLFSFICIYLLKDNAFFNEVFLSRFEINDGKLAGDTRGGRFSDGLHIIKGMSFSHYVFGVDSRCLTDIDACNRLFKPFGETFLYPFISQGVISLPYYIVIFLFLISCFKSRKISFIHLSIVALLLQRPYVMLYGYSLLILLALSLNFSKGKEKISG